MHWLAVALGGSIGAMCRYGVAMALPHAPGKLPVATLLVNILGSFLMGAFFVLILEKNLLPLMWRQVIMVGFLGALTTFSTFSLESVQLFSTGHWRVALIYSVLSVCASIAAAACGYGLLNKIL